MLSTGFALILLAWGVCAQEPDVMVAFSTRLNVGIADVDTSTIVRYTETAANAGGWYNEETGGFLVPPGQHGLYYMGQSIGTPEGKWCQTNVYQAGSGRTFSGLKQDNMFTDNVEFSSRGYMQEITENMNNALEIRGDLECSLNGDPYGTTTWTVFRYGDTQDAGVSFSVARNNNFETESESVNWNREFVNAGGPGNPSPLNSSTGFFKAPRHGYYFFHYSALSLPSRPLQAILLHWPISEPIMNTVSSLNRTSQNIIGSDTTGRSIIIEMNANDQVSMGNLDGSSLGSSPDGFELSFSGFGYALEAAASLDVVAFCAYMENWSWNEPTTQVLTDWYGTTVNVFGGGAPPFDPVSGDFVAPMVGTYFLSFSVGVTPSMRCVAVLTDSVGYEVSRIDRRNSAHDGYDTLSRDVVMDLVPGQAVRIQAGSGSSLFSSSLGREVAFMAIRLRTLPDEPEP